MKRFWIPTAAALLLLFSVSTAQAQAGGGMRFGAQISLGDEVDLGIGARAGFGLEQFMDNLQGVATFDFFFPGNDITFWAINVNAHYPLELNGGNLLPYVGGGLGLAHWSWSYDLGFLGSDTYSENKINLNLIAGTKFAGQGSMTPFAELRMPLGGFSGIGYFLCGGVWF